jgi:peptidoglycan hydrolase-like protein with peptidoglycan-binding domain
LEREVPNMKLIDGFLTGALAIAMAGAAMAQADTQKTSQASTQRDATESKIDGTVFHAQVLLDRAGFSPGVIDGEQGISFTAAVKGFQEARGLDVTGELDQPTRAALLRDKSPSTRRLRIDESDARGQFVGQIPKDPAEQAKMQRLG